MARFALDPIGSALTGTQEPAALQARRDRILALEAQLAERRATVAAGWGSKVAAAVHARGQLCTLERIDRLKDEGSELLPLGSFVNWGRSFEGSRKQAPGAGVVTGFVRVCDRWVVVVANDNLVASGAWWPQTPEKIQRAQEVALRLRLPVVYLVESSGLFLPEQAHAFPGRTGAGAIFRLNALLSASGVPQVAGVFGPCIAGGGYMPIISDRVVMTEQAYMVIAGAALIRGAKAMDLTSLDIGGAEVHVHLSGCADVRVPDDEACLCEIRAEIQRLPSSAAPWFRHGDGPLEPEFPATELPSVFPDDHRVPYDMRQVLARLVDASLFHEVLPDRGNDTIVGVGRVGGLWMGFAANQVESFPHPEIEGALRPGGILYREGIAKMSAFSRACNEDGIPLVWLQDVAGFDIGTEAEAQGLLGFGSSLIYTNSTNDVPMITFLLRRSSGAGYYAQAGLPFAPVLQLGTPLSRLAVMEGRTAAIASNIHHLDQDLEIASQDPVERVRVRAAMDEVAGRVERDMDPYGAAARMDLDEIVGLSELRPWLCALAEMCYQSTGYRRVRNPRIWTLHDLETLCSEP